MAKIENTTECLDILVNTMKKNGVEELEYRNDDFEIRLSMHGKNQPAPIVMPAQYQPSAVSVSVAAATSSAVAEQKSGNIVKSPIVGTYYSSAAPDKPAFVSVGKSVSKGDVLMIIESMKVMNEIKSEFDGVVEEIFAKSGDAVEYDQPLMRIV